MLHEKFVSSAVLLFVLLNPFLMSVYLLDLIQDMTWRAFFAVMIRGASIACVVFVAFGLLGDTIFTDILQVRFASFVLFGGVIFLLVSVRSFFVGAGALRELRGDPKHVAGSIAMPFMIGPGTISASVAAGSGLPTEQAVLAIVLPVLASVLAVLVLKWIFDFVQTRSEELIARYVDVTGRIMALVTGTIAVDMILRGLEMWRAAHLATNVG